MSLNSKHLIYIFLTLKVKALKFPEIWNGGNAFNFIVLKIQELSNFNPPNSKF